MMIIVTTIDENGKKHCYHANWFGEQTLAAARKHYARREFTASGEQIIRVDLPEP